MSSKRKEFRELVSLDDAKRTLTPFYKRVVEHVPLGECHGRTLAVSVSSDVDVPPFDRASMDGYAVKAKDTWGADEESPRTLKLIGALHAGDMPSMSIEPGTAVEIATGAMMPAGANAVVMVENTDLQGDSVNVRKPVSQGDNVMHAGADIMRGEMVLRKGTVLTFREIGALAAIGMKAVPVYRKPTVAIISTGNEIAMPGETLKPGQIFDVNAYAVAAGVLENGGEPVMQGIVRDTGAAFKDAVSCAAKDADVILTSGSTSAGASDMMYGTIGAAGKVLVHGIKIKPGKPTIIGEISGKPFVGLPGYPSSAITIFNEVVAPMLRYMSGAPAHAAAKVTARMALRAQSEGGREVLLPVGLVRTADGLAAYPVEKGSGAVTSLLDADGYIEITEDTHVIEEGMPVEVTLFYEDVAFPDLLMIGSHCLGVDIIIDMMEERGFNVRSINVGSTGGFRAIRKNIADAAGVHLLDESGEYNRPFMKALGLDNAELVKGYVREQGIIVAAGNPENIKSIEDLPGKRFINRTKGSGTRTLLDIELKKLAANKVTTLEAIADKMPGYDVEAKTHSAVASAILTGKADAGLGIGVVAVQNGLGFIPLKGEEYDFLVRKQSMDKPAMKAFLDILRSKELAERLAKLGYTI